VALVRLVKVYEPIESGVFISTVTEVKLLQPSKAWYPMLVTELGMVIEDRPLQPSKAYSPMLVTVFGITVLLHPVIKVLVFVSMIALQLYRESYFEFPLSTIIEDRPLQSEKAPFPMLVTELGMVTEVRPLQPRKVYALILFT
jgi:hypothetical protein